MKSKIGLAGQWHGHFIYGPEYGDELHGEKVTFRFFLNNISADEFEGTSVDIEGAFANFDEAKIKGYVDGASISFTKEYSTYYVFEEYGSSTVDKGQSPRLSYSGEYNSNTKSFSGEWELIANEILFGDSSLVDISTGRWEMVKDEE